MKPMFKTLLISLTMLSFAFTANAKDPADALIDKYDGKKGFEVMIIGKDMLQMATQVPMMSKEQKKLFNDSEEMVILAYNGKNPTIESMYNEALELFAADTHTKTIDFNENGVKGKIFAVEEGKFVTKINIIMNEKGKNLQIMVMKGKYDEESFKEAQKPQQKMF